MFREILTFPDLPAMAVAVAERVGRDARDAVAERGVFFWCLTGGKSAAAVYNVLAAGNVPAPWDKTDFFWGDERAVPPESVHSNYGMAERTLLSRVAAPPNARCRPKGELGPAAGAADYEKTLRERNVTFDLTLLSMGPDGHIASLFPGSPALDETERLVLAVPSPTTTPPAVPRITLTFPALGRSRDIVLMVAGPEKRALFERVLADNPKTADLPVARFSRLYPITVFIG